MHPVRLGRSRQVCRVHHPGWDRSCESFGPGEAGWRVEADCPIVLGGGEGMAGQFSCTALDGKAYVAGPFGLLSFSPEEGWATLPASPTAGGCPVVAATPHARESGPPGGATARQPGLFSDGCGPAGCCAALRARESEVESLGRRDVATRGRMPPSARASALGLTVVTPRLLAACVATNQLPAAQQVLQLARRGGHELDPQLLQTVQSLEDAARLS